MHSTSGDLDTSFEGLLLCIFAFERRQQRRMNVDEAALPLGDEGRRQDAHEPR